jgi:aspartate aminotransferase
LKGDGNMTTRLSGIRLAKRLDEVGFSDIVQVRNKVMELRAEGLQVHAMHGGEPFFETPEAIKYAAIRALVENETHYAPSSGLLPLRKALVDKLAEKNGIHANPDEVIVTVGGAQGLYAAFQSVLDQGDDALVFSPFWTPIGDQVTGAQARPLLVPTISARRNGIRKTLEQFSTPKTRAIYYNTPQNPSGIVFTRAEAEEVAAFAIERDLVVIADEAYEDLCSGQGALHDGAAQDGALLDQRSRDAGAVRDDPGAQDAGDGDRAPARGISKTEGSAGSRPERSGPGLPAAGGRLLCIS